MKGDPAEVLIVNIDRLWGAEEPMETDLMKGM